MIQNPSPEQLKIRRWFQSGSGNLIVRARAGCGKTTTILDGVEHAPELRVLLAAFNKAIAQELQARVKSNKVDVKTLHGLGYAFIRDSWGRVQVDTDGRRAVELSRAACDLVAQEQRKREGKRARKSEELVPCLARRFANPRSEKSKILRAIRSFIPSTPTLAATWRRAVCWPAARAGA